MLASGKRALPPALTTVSEGPTQMPSAISTVGPAALAALGGAASIANAPCYSVVNIGRALRPGPRAASAGKWRVVDGSPSGMFIDGLGEGAVAASDKTNVRFGDTSGGKALTFEAVRPSNSTEERHSDNQSSDADPGLVRAGAAAAARRRELDISQRSLAADGIINAGALIAFEKGRSWPRDRTRAKLEEVLQWPPGTIERIRDGAAVPYQAPAAPAAEVVPEGPTLADGPASLIAQAVAAAVDT